MFYDPGIDANSNWVVNWADRMNKLTGRRGWSVKLAKHDPNPINNYDRPSDEAIALAKRWESAARRKADKDTE